jgi:glycosyltransferase involved in cell wall biosynthesis
MTSPKITVITPVRNAETIVETAIRSVAGQSYSNIEHLLVDGSTRDQTAAVIRKLQHTFPHLCLISGPDSGIYDAMNKGMDAATGDWFYFLGADDEFHDADVLRDLVEMGLFNKEHIVYGNVIIRGNSSWASDNTIYDGAFDLEKLFRRNICHQAVFYPAVVRSQIGKYHEKYVITADWDFNIRCFASFPFTYTERMIAIFRGGGKSSGQGDSSFYEDLPGNVIRYFNLDPTEDRYHDFNSPFYGPLSRYREMALRATVETLGRENAEMVSRLEEKQQEELRALRNDFTNKVLLLEEEMTGLRELISRKEATYQETIFGLQEHARLYGEELARKKDEINRLLETLAEKESHIGAIYRSYTWKAGKILLSPVTAFLRK